MITSATHASGILSVSEAASVGEKGDSSSVQSGNNPPPFSCGAKVSKLVEKQYRIVPLEKVKQNV